jgi:hypothetical protein
MYTFNADRISSYELGSDEPNALVNTTNLFTASADQILNQMGKVSIPIRIIWLMTVGVTLCISV